MVKKFEDIFIRFERDRHRMTP